MVLAPHPDDETFGCGQLIAEMCKAGRKVHVIILSNGAGSHNGCCNISENELVQGRYNDCRQAMEILQLPLENLHFCGFPDGRLADILPQKYDELEDMVKSFNCQTVFAPHPLEGWSDHLAVSKLADNLGAKLQIRRIYYCVWFYFSMPFRKFHLVKWRSSAVFGTGKTHQRKLAACRIYLEDYAPCGSPFAGVLPKELQKAVQHKKELFYEA